MLWQYTYCINQQDLMLDCFYKYTDKNQFEKSKNKNNKFVFCKINMNIKDTDRFLEEKKIIKIKLRLIFQFLTVSQLKSCCLGLVFPFLLHFKALLCLTVHFHSNTHKNNFFLKNNFKKQQRYVDNYQNAWERQTL